MGALLRGGNMVVLKKSKCIFVLILVLCTLVLSGCFLENIDISQERKAGEEIKHIDKEVFDFSPQTKPDGSKYQIALLDIDEYEPASIYFYYVLVGLKNIGWIEFDQLPFTENSTDVKVMMQELSKMDLGPYVEFVGDAAYYLGYEEEQDIRADLAEKINSPKGIDIVLAMGTWPGQFMKDSKLDVNTLVCMATDPVQSGIIESAEKSGNDNIWAQVEPSPYYRQIKFYHNIYPFKNIGMVYTDPIVAGIPDYKNGAKELDIQISERMLDKEQLINADTNEFKSDELLAIFEEMVRKDKIDAFMINADLIKGEMPLNYYLKPFNDANIPVFIQDGENYVREGALMLVASTDNKGVGQFVANVSARVFKGENPGDIDCVYVSSPYISINLDAAKSLGFRPSFELLLTCETIYSEANKK